MYRIQGTSEDNIGQYIVGHYNKLTDQCVMPPYSAMGWTKNGGLVAQVVFVNYLGSNIQLHINAPRVFNRIMIEEIYTYIFKQLKCNRLTAFIRDGDEKLLRLLPRLGFEYEVLLTDYLGDADSPLDAHVLKLTKNNALRYLDVLRQYTKTACLS